MNIADSANIIQSSWLHVSLINIMAITIISNLTQPMTDLFCFNAEASWLWVLILSVYNSAGEYCPFMMCSPYPLKGDKLYDDQCC